MSVQAVRLTSGMANAGYAVSRVLLAQLTQRLRAAVLIESIAGRRRPGRGQRRVPPRNFS
jgi:hypothetical protein